MAEIGQQSIPREHPTDLTPARAEGVRLELDRILESPAFRNSKRSQRFLRFVVEAALNGQADGLKERTLAMEVFDRPAEFDSSGDAAVRVAALEVRKRLTRYYAETGMRDAVQIGMALGHYVPEFRFRDETPARPASRGRSKRWILTWGMAGLALGMLGTAVAALRWYTDSGNASYRAFWQPVLENPNPVLICLDSPRAYTWNEGNREFTASDGRFVELGDAIGAGHLAAVLSRFHKEDQTRVVGDLSFADLRRSPTILVGGSLSLAHALAGDYRFSIEVENQERVIREHAEPHRIWRLSADAEMAGREDYGVATRLFDSEPGRVTIMVAGLSHYGTKAAAEFLGGPRYLSAALAQLPAGWQNKNLQFVLHAQIIGKTTGPPTVLAAHVW